MLPSFLGKLPTDFQRTTFPFYTAAHHHWLREKLAHAVFSHDKKGFTS